MKKAYFILIVFFLVVILAMPRFVGLDKFVSLDEPFWVRNGANFYYALSQHQFENTIYEYHPGITTMWVVSLGLLAYFPNYGALQEGYLPKKQFDEFLAQNGKTELGLFLYSRLVQSILIVLLLLTIFFLLRSLFGNRTAFFTTALVSLSPFFLGNSRLLNHEAIMGLFILISILGLTIYLFKKGNIFLLILSALAGALAQLTKSTGFLLFPIVGLIVVSYLIESRKDFSSKIILDTLKTLCIWAAVLVAAYFLFWPGMWVAPGQMLDQVYGNALSYGLEGSRISVSGGLTPSQFSVNSQSEVLGRIGNFIMQMLWHTTPLSWIGFVLGISFIFIRQKKSVKQIYQWMILYFIVLAVLFILLFSIARGRDSAHYILTSYLCVDMIAGLGMSALLEQISDKWFEKKRGAVSAGIVVALLAVQAIFIIGSFPYYYTYLNPLMEIAPASAKNVIYADPSYGEGLESAAEYLSEKPDADTMTVMSYGGYGCFSFFFPGTTLVINDVSVVHPSPAIIKYLRASSYVVLDHRFQQAYNDLAGFEGITPEKIIWINGVEYFDIYRATDLLERINANLTSQ
ncbi:MAG: glycosyltransferase family 39 protein [Anaerolineales bacterium]